MHRAIKGIQGALRDRTGIHLVGSLAVTAALVIALDGPAVPVAVAASTATTSATSTTTTTSVVSTTVQETSSRITYHGTWRQAAYAGYNGGGARFSTQTGASAVLSFTGTGVYWIGPTGPTRGYARVYVDGVYVQAVSTYSSSFVARKMLWSATWTTQAAHTVKIVVSGTAGHPTVAIDAIVLHSISTLHPSNPIQITTDNVTIDGAAITSSGTTGIGIVAEGTASHPIHNITIRNCSISGFSIGIEARHVVNLVIDHCAIANADYAGIAVYSGVGGRITNNVVRKIGYTRTNFSGQWGNNAYGITLDHYAYSTLTADPFSSGFVVDHNTVEDVPLWMCFNVHAAQNTTFSNNTSRGCPRAFFIAGDATGNPSRNITVTRNTLEDPVTKSGGTADVEGVLISRLQGGAVTYNQIARGYSPPINDYLGASTNVTISGNTVIP